MSKTFRASTVIRRSIDSNTEVQRKLARATVEEYRMKLAKNNVAIELTEMYEKMWLAEAAENSGVQRIYAAAMANKCTQRARELRRERDDNKRKLDAAKAAAK
jgi:hypothetical protein